MPWKRSKRVLEAVVDVRALKTVLLIMYLTKSLLLRVHSGRKPNLKPPRTLALSHKYPDVALDNKKIRKNNGDE